MMRTALSLVAGCALAACSSHKTGVAGDGGAGDLATDNGGGGGGGGGSAGGGGGGGGDDLGTPVPPIKTWRNTLNWGPDPFMTYYAGNYYLSTTQGDALRMWKAPTIGKLAVAPAVEVWRDPDATRNQQVWAPSFYLLNGRWYLYYTADDGVDDHHRLYVVESNGVDPLGPYHFKARLDVPGADYWAIDPVLLVRGGATYMLWSGAGPEGHNLLYIAPMSNPWTISGGRTYLPASGGCPEVREAPSILQRGGRSFLVYSSCDTGKPDYQLWMKSVADNADPLNAASWQQHGAVFTRNDGNGVWGPGSNGFFQSPDGKEDWIVYHGKNTSAYAYEARTTRAQKITWNGDGTPNLGSPVAAGATLDVPSGDGGGGAYFINDTNTSSGAGAVAFSAGWTAYASCGAQCFLGDDHGSTTTGATATFSFTGTQIALFSAQDAGNGIAALSLDGGAEQNVDYWSRVRVGEQLVYVSPRAPFGPHSLKLRVTGQKNASSSGVAVSVDRAEVYVN